MEDDNIRSLFADFDPDLSSSFQFMDRVEREIDNMEIVHKHLTARRQRSRIAMAVAACVGFVVGFVLALYIPYFEALIQGVSLPAMPDSPHRSRKNAKTRTPSPQAELSTARKRPSPHSAARQTEQTPFRHE